MDYGRFHLLPEWAKNKWKEGIRAKVKTWAVSGGEGGLPCGITGRCLP